jgi:hypothetical protein
MLQPPKVERLMAMGFTRAACEAALACHHDDLDRAALALASQPQPAARGGGGGGADQALPAAKRVRVADKHTERRRQREAEQAELLSKFTQQRFADEATARRCLKQTGWKLEEAMALYMPPVPDSPVAGKSLAGAAFKGGYDKATVPKGQMQLGGLVMKLVEGYCSVHSIPYRLQ